jgi:hypothetical protein
MGFASSLFGGTPDPRRLYWSATHRGALASLVHGRAAGLGGLLVSGGESNDRLSSR